MDKITSSDKFKQLRSNIIGTKRFKSSKDSNCKEKHLANITGVRIVENHDQFSRSKKIRGSPRRCQEFKEFDLKKLHCSFRTNAGPAEFSQSEGQNSIRISGIPKDGTHQEYRSEEAVTKAFRNQTSFIEKPERDSAGFLKPLPPAPKRNLHVIYVEEELKTFNQLLHRLTDFNIFHKVEIAYHIEKLYSYCLKTSLKLTRNSNLSTAITQSSSWSDRIQSWLHSSQAVETYKLPDPRMDNLEKSSKVLSKLNEKTLNASDGSQRTTAYLLKDWSVSKGSEEMELMVSGMLIDIRSRKVLEQNHKSSCIIERTGNNFVKTICCIYQLCGNFVEGEKDIPQEIKKYFKEGKFPENWKSVASKWHSLNLNNAATLRKNKPCSKNTIKRRLEDIVRNDREIDVKAKKMKGDYKETPRATFESKSREKLLNPASSRSHLNSSILTRSAIRKNRLFN